MTADEVFWKIRAYYRANEWVVLPQLRDGTGYGSLRTADAVAMNAWPSRGMEVHGLEIKVSRSDWLHELKQPEKAESVFKYCDRWWIVAPKVPGLEIVRTAELPPTWGLMLCGEGGIEVSVGAPRLDAHELGRPFIASVLRSLEKYESPAAKIEAARAAGFDEGVEQGREIQRKVTPRFRSDYEHQRSRMLGLEEEAKSILKEIQRSLVNMKRIVPEEEVAREG